MMKFETVNIVAKITKKVEKPQGGSGRRGELFEPNQKRSAKTFGHKIWLTRQFHGGGKFMTS